MSEKCEVLEQPPKRENMGLFQIIQIVAMGIVAILHIFDIFLLILAELAHYTFVISFFNDILIVTAVIFMIVGYFAPPCAKFVKLAMFSYFLFTIIDIIFFFWIWIKFSDSTIYVVLNIFKLLFTSYLAFVFFKQIKNV